MMKLFHFSPKDNLNEVIFEHRNKNYGAYNLRAEEGNILQKALFFGIAAFVSVAAIPLIINSFHHNDIPKDGGFVLPPPIVIVDPVEIVKPEVVKAEPIQARPDVKVVQSQIPTPTKFVEKEKTLAKKSDMDNAALGFDDTDGKDTKVNIVVPNVDVPKGPTIDFVKPVVTVPMDENRIVEIADVEAKFPGGINAFRNQVGKYFDQRDFDGTGELMKTTITFVVEKDGSISNIKANGKDKYFNDEALRTIQKINAKWIPAQVKGKNVRYAFKMPISMQFD